MQLILLLTLAHALDTKPLLGVTIIIVISDQQQHHRRRRRLRHRHHRHHHHRRRHHHAIIFVFSFACVSLLVGCSESTNNGK